MPNWTKCADCLYRVEQYCVTVSLSILLSLLFNFYCHLHCLPIFTAAFQALQLLLHLENHLLPLHVLSFSIYYHCRHLFFNIYYHCRHLLFILLPSITAFRILPLLPYHCPPPLTHFTPTPPSQLLQKKRPNAPKNPSPPYNGWGGGLNSSQPRKIKLRG